MHAIMLFLVVSYPIEIDSHSNQHRNMNYLSILDVRFNILYLRTHNLSTCDNSYLESYQNIGSVIIMAVFYILSCTRERFSVASKLLF